jgi:hypothetical protein
MIPAIQVRQTAWDAQQAVSADRMVAYEEEALTTLPRPQ